MSGDACRELWEEEMPALVADCTSQCEQSGEDVRLEALPEACEGLIERARELSPEFGARCGGVYVPPPPPPFDPCPDACEHAVVCAFGEIGGEGGLCPNDISDRNRESLMSSCLWSCGLGDGNGAEGIGPEVPCEEVVAHLLETVEPFSIICGR